MSHLSREKAHHEHKKCCRQLLLLMTSNRRYLCNISTHLMIRIFSNIHHRIHKLGWFVCIRGYLWLKWQDQGIWLCRQEGVRMFIQSWNLDQRSLLRTSNWHLGCHHPFWRVREGHRIVHEYLHKWWLENRLFERFPLRQGFIWLWHKGFWLIALIWFILCVIEQFVYQEDWSCY